VKNRKLVLAIFGLMVFALAGVPKAAEVPGEKSAAGTEALEQEAVSLLSEYLRVDTTNPPGNEVKAAQFFKTIFDRERIEARILESAPGRGNIYARLKGDGSKKAVVLMNHMDVVPADRRYWSVDPFAGVVKDGFI
jgi:acetylornithine deacetylase/succinyl-diaminopimelate desuccinylase-like protein